MPSARPGVPIRFGIRIFLAGLIVIIRFIASNVAGRFLVQFAAFKRTIDSPVTPLLVDAQRCFLLIIARGILVTTVLARLSGQGDSAANSPTG